MSKWLPKSSLDSIHNLRYDVSIVHPSGELFGTLADSEHRHSGGSVAITRPTDFGLLVQYTDGGIA